MSNILTVQEKHLKSPSCWDAAYQTASDLPCRDEGLCHATVASAVAGGDEVGYSTAFQKGSRGHGVVFTEELGKGNHLHQPQPDHRCFGVVSTLQAVTETRTHGHDVLNSRSKIILILKTIILLLLVILLDVYSTYHPLKCKEKGTDEQSSGKQRI